MKLLLATILGTIPLFAFTIYARFALDDYANEEKNFKAQCKKLYNKYKGQR